VVVAAVVVGAMVVVVGAAVVVVGIMVVVMSGVGPGGPAGAGAGGSSDLHFL